MTDEEPQHGPAPEHDPEHEADRKVARRMRVFLTLFACSTTILYRYTGQGETADKVASGLTIGLVLWWFGIGIVLDRKKDK